ncbi:hypothetical protein J2S74_003054 [Evansella vedderi]|uniref:Uncharacterized protein n=1 Tax=Evansella vedderi TaxID=38282 RepID=A0ABT9ZY69_9BACI|nr:hypothetical protein [Evansella vedderi]MDQ0255672.1 hypothetical protein [Evansella vedderi]
MESIQINPLTVECTLFFQENPYTFETLSGLGTRLGRKPEDLRPVLDELVTNTILEIMGTGDNAIYRYNQPKSVDMNGLMI